jgi:hypothetical protein
VGYNQETKLHAEQLPRINKKAGSFKSFVRKWRDGLIINTSGWNNIEVRVWPPDCKGVKRTELNNVKEILEFWGNDKIFLVSKNSEYFDNLQHKQRSRRKINPNFFCYINKKLLIICEFLYHFIRNVERSFVESNMRHFQPTFYYWSILSVVYFNIRLRFHPPYIFKKWFQINFGKLFSSFKTSQMSKESVPRDL